MNTIQTITLTTALFFIASNETHATNVSIVRSGSQIVLSWPQTDTNDFYLQVATNLSPSVVWSNATDPATNGPNLVITNDATSSSRFYRLQAWEILFDGTSTEAFRGYKQTTFPPTDAWVVTTNRELMAVFSAAGSQFGRTNDLITKTQYGNFELRWEWKTTTNGNSGVVLRVTEPSGTNNFSTQTGPEYQLLDSNASDESIGNRSMGASYGLFAPTTNKVVVPTGQWNDCRLIVQGNHVEHWLNSGKVLEYEINGPGWTQAVANYPGGSLLPGFGETSPAAIAFQQHGQQIWFRSIRIRRLGQ
jgi:hypothetical protein